MVAIAGAGLTLWALTAIAPDMAAVPPGPPRVIETYPAANATVPAGALTIRVTFDQPMRSGSFSFVTTSAGRYPDCAKAPQQSTDGRSFTLGCRITPGGSYAIGFNGGRFRNFVGKANGLPATPAVLRFVAAP